MQGLELAEQVRTKQELALSLAAREERLGGQALEAIQALEALQLLEAWQELQPQLESAVSKGGVLAWQLVA